jgi:hypothetical protein
VAAKRQWSKAFTPRSDKRGVALHVSNIPVTLKQKFAAKCRREGKSQRNLLLSWVRNWVEGRRPDENVTGRDETHTTDTAEMAL